MSNLFDRPLALIPRPQKLDLLDGDFRPRTSWRKFEFRDGQDWALAANRRLATRLVRQLKLTPATSPEAYHLRLFENGVAARSAAPAGARHAQATLNQLLTLANNGPLPQVEIHDWPDLAIRGMHLDLKYFMHNVAYLHTWLEDIASFKINTVLLEYEDKFPYRKYPFLRHPDAFSETQLREFLAHARRLGLRVIPLIQTFGHVEYILKHAAFAALRVNDFYTEYNVQHPQVWPLIRDIVDEVLEYHTDDEWFHIGGDECWSLQKEKPEYQAKVYGQHMGRILRYVIRRGKRPLLWNDMVDSVIGRSPQSKKRLFQSIPRQTILSGYRGYNGPQHPTVPARGAGLLPEPGGIKGKWPLRRSGYDMYGIPCNNWGAINPYLPIHTVANTIELIREAVDNDGLGIINTQWAVFHSPLPLLHYGLALTADRSWKVAPGTLTVRDFDENYCRLVFGLSNRTLVEALYQLGEGLLEMPTDLGRGIHLPYFYYMDAVLHFANAHKDRLRYGPVIPAGTANYPLIVEKKLALLQQSPYRKISLIALARVRDQARSAGQLLKSLGRPKRGGNEYDLIVWMAHFRAHGAQRMLALANAAPLADRHGLLRESRALRRQMQKIYGRFLMRDELQLETASLFDGEEQLLKSSPHSTG